MNEDQQIETIETLVPALLTGLQALEFVIRHLHPQLLPQLAEKIDHLDGKLEDALTAFNACTFPEDRQQFIDHLRNSADETLSGLREFKIAANDTTSPLAAFKALRHLPRAQAHLYPLAPIVPVISHFFIEPSHRDDETIQQKVDNPQTGGIFHFNNTKDERGGYSLYVPEHLSSNEPVPLVMALHGGSGHGRSFLWTWLKSARTFDFILVTPTSVGATWDLMEADRDNDNLRSIVDQIAGEWPIDTQRMLLTGMSDGGTFTFVSGLDDQSPFTHLAPISTGFQPMLFPFMSEAKIRSCPIYLIHGLLDWMFPAQIARQNADHLKSLGAQVTYEEPTTLSHTYPSDFNPLIADWFLNT